MIAGMKLNDYEDQQRVDFFIQKHENARVLLIFIEWVN